MGKQQQLILEEIENRKRQGLPTGPMGMVAATTKVAEQIRKELAKETADINRKHGNVYDENDVMKGIVCCSHGGGVMTLCECVTPMVCGRFCRP